MIAPSFREQTKELIYILSKNRFVMEILNHKLFPKNISWYLAAGCISQSVWNYLSNRQITSQIKDYDLIYYDNTDISYEAEDVYIQKGSKLFSTLPIEVEIKNQARVHLWYEKHFGQKINQLKSCEDAINGWSTTVSAVGINKINGKINIYAPYGLSDLFGMIVRPNKLFTTKQAYEKKVTKWIKKWPNLRIIPYT